MNQNDTVYVIDDNEAIGKALRWLLEPANIVVEFYSSAINFLASYQLNWQGCVLIDMKMPDMNGLQLLEKLIALGNSMPIIILSGHSDISTAVQALKRGAVDFITKPFNDEILLEKIKNVLALRKNLTVN